MRAIAIHFPERRAFRRGRYERLLAVLRASWEHHCPAIPLEVYRPKPDRTLRCAIAAREAARQSFADNTDKMRAWEIVMAEAEDGETIAFLDCDLMITGPCDELADAVTGSPLAFTFKAEGQRFPFNSGVVAARVCEDSRQFFRRWREVNEAMLGDAERHAEFRERYGGINQAALGEMLETAGCPPFTRLDCSTWNCEDSSWPLFTANTRIVHIKGRLRAAVMGCIPPAERSVFRLWEIWKRWEDNIQDKQ
jgi:hypothetical protein